MAVDSRSQHDNAASKKDRERGTTPFAYATPHSNSTTMLGIAGMTGYGGDDDTVLGTDLADEEWEGVGDFEDGDGDDDDREVWDDGQEEEENDDEDDESVASGENSAYGDTDVDEEEGMTIYEF